MHRKYLEEEIETLKEEFKDAKKENDTQRMDEALAEIKKLKAKDRPFERIYIDNDITLATLKKIARNYEPSLRPYSEQQQPLENLDNGFITPEALDFILRRILREKRNGSFPKGVKNLFGTRKKIRFIKSKLAEYQK